MLRSSSEQPADNTGQYGSDKPIKKDKGSMSVDQNRPLTIKDRTGKVFEARGAGAIVDIFKAIFKIGGYSFTSKRAGEPSTQPIKQNHDISQLKPTSTQSLESSQPSSHMNEESNRVNQTEQRVLNPQENPVQTQARPTQPNVQQQQRQPIQPPIQPSAQQGQQQLNPIQRQPGQISQSNIPPRMQPTQQGRQQTRPNLPSNQPIAQPGQQQLRPIQRQPGQISQPNIPPRMQPTQQGRQQTPPIQEQPTQTTQNTPIQPRVEAQSIQQSIVQPEEHTEVSIENRVVESRQHPEESISELVLPNLPTLPEEPLAVSTEHTIPQKTQKEIETENKVKQHPSFREGLDQQGAEKELKDATNGSMLFRQNGNELEYSLKLAEGNIVHGKAIISEKHSTRAGAEEFLKKEDTPVGTVTIRLNLDQPGGVVYTIKNETNLDNRLAFITKASELSDAQLAGMLFPANLNEQEKEKLNAAVSAISTVPQEDKYDVILMASKMTSIFDINKQKMVSTRAEKIEAIAANLVLAKAHFTEEMTLKDKILKIEDVSNIIKLMKVKDPQKQNQLVELVFSTPNENIIDCMKIASQMNAIIDSQGQRVTDKVEILKAVTTAYDEVKDFFTEGMPTNDKINILTRYLSIPPDDRENVATWSKELFREGMSGTEKSIIMVAVSKLNETDRANVIEHMKSLSHIRMDGAEMQHVMKAIANVPESDRADVIKHVQIFFTGMEDGRHYGWVQLAIEQIVKTPPQDRFIMQYVGALQNPTDTYPKLFKITEKLLELNKLNQTDLPDLVDHMKEYLTGKHDFREHTLINMMEELADIPKEDRREVMGIAKSAYSDIRAPEWSKSLKMIATALEPCKVFFTESMNFKEKLRILDIVSKIPKEDLPAFVDSVNKLSQGQQGTNTLTVITALSGILKDDIPTFIDFIDDLTKDMNAQQKSSIIKTVSTIPKEERVFAVQLAKMYIQIVPDSTIEEALKIAPQIKDELAIIKHAMSTGGAGGEELLAIISEVIQRSGGVPPQSLKAAQLNIDLNKLQTPPEAEIQFGDHTNISIDQLFTLFDNINFDNPGEPGYVAPSVLSDDGELKPKEHFRKGLETLQQRITGNQNYTAVPTEERARTAWYAKLESTLKEVIRLSNEHASTEPGLVATEIVRLGAAGHHCGGRWVSDTNGAVKAISGQWTVDVESQGMEQTCNAWINNYKEGVLEKLTLQFTPRMGFGMGSGAAYQPHIYNYVAKCMKEKGIPLPNSDAIDLNDNLISHVADSIKKGEINKELDRYFGVTALSQFVSDSINEGLQLNKGEFTDKIVDVMRGCAEAKIPEEIKVLESTLEEKKIAYGKAKVEQLLENEQIKQAILNDDTQFLSDKNQMKVRPIRQSVNNEVSDRAEEYAQANGISEEEAEEIIRSEMKQEIAGKIATYSDLLHSESKIEELKDLGKDRATTEQKAAKNDLCDAYLKKAGLLTYEKVEVFDEIMQSNEEIERPHIEVLGGVALLKSLEFFSV